MEFNLDELKVELELMKCRIKELQIIIDESIKEENKKKEHKKTIVFDFDGVIHTGYKGWKDGTIYGEIDEQLLDYIYQLQKKYYIVISSNRPAEQIVKYMNEWCEFHYVNLKFEVFNKSEEEMYWLVDDVIGVTNHKAIGAIYIDDRGYRYRGLEDLKEYIEVVGVDLI